MDKTNKTLILTVDLSGAPEWQVLAMQRQMSAWLVKNKTLLPFENLIIFPTVGETRLYWLEGTADKIKTLEEIKDRIKPILEVALGLKIDKKKVFADPGKKYNKAVQELHKMRVNHGKTAQNN